MIRRVALAILFVPVLVVAISLLGLLFGAVGTAISLVLHDHTEIRTTGFRVIVMASLAVVTWVGVARILNVILQFVQKVGYQTPRLRQVASDSMLVLVAFGGLVGIAFLGFALLGFVPDQRLPLVICGAILTTASSSLLVPRIRRARRSVTPPPSGDRPSGAASVGIPRSPESTAAQADRAG